MRSTTGPMDTAAELLAGWQIEQDFTDFYRAEVAALVTFLLRLGASGQDAADLAQDTMIDAYRSWSIVTNPYGWIRRVASRKFLRLISQIEPPAVRRAASALLRADNEFEHWEQSSEVLRQLRQLPARQRQVMAWCYDGYGPTEIAEELGITPEAVRSNLMKARRALSAAHHQAGGAP